MRKSIFLRVKFILILIIEFEIDNIIMNKDNGNQYKNQDIYIVQFPEGRELSFSQGEIQSIQNERIEHLVSTHKGSSCSPILVLNNQEFKVIGIHKNKNKDLI